MRSPVRISGTNRALSWLVLVASLSLSAAACVQPELADMDDGELAPLSESANALSWIPADAAVVAVVPDLAQLSDDITLLGQQLALPTGAWELLPALRELTGAHVGLREDGAFLTVFPDAASVIDADEPPLVFLAPVTDYDVFLSNYGAVAEPGVPTLLSIDYDWELYALPLPGYAVLGMTAAHVEAFRPALSEGESIAPLLGELGTEIFEGSDATVVLNVAAMRPYIDTADADLLGYAMGGSSCLEALSELDRQTISAVSAAFAEAAIDGTTAVVMGVDIERAGMDVSFSANLVPDSAFGAPLRRPGGAAALLAELPDLPATSVGAISMRGIDRDALADWLISALPNDGHLAELVSEMAELTRSTTDMAGLWRPASASEDGSVNASHSLSLMYTDDGASTARTYERYLRYLEGFAMPLPVVYTEVDTEVTASAEFVVDYVPGDTTWGDATIDRYSMEIVLPGSYRDAALEAGAEWVLRSYPARYEGVLAIESNRILGSSGFDDATVQDVLAGRINTSAVDRAQLIDLRSWAQRPDPFLEMSVDLSHVWPHWHGDSAAPERPMAVYGHGAEHEMGFQFVLPASSLQPF